MSQLRFANENDASSRVVVILQVGLSCRDFLLNISLACFLDAALLSLVRCEVLYRGGLRYDLLQPLAFGIGANSTSSRRN